MKKSRKLCSVISFILMIQLCLVNSVVAAETKQIFGGKCWCDSDMFAYVKNNKLYLTGSDAASLDDYECYKGETVKTFFEGKGINMIAANTKNVAMIKKNKVAYGLGKIKIMR